MNAIASTAGLDAPPVDDLVGRARGGDLAAFEELYRRHAGRVYAICRRISVDPALAEDQTQETFVRVWRKLAGLRGDDGFEPWLRRVAINVALGERRSRTRRATRELPAADPDRFAARPGAARGRDLDLERAIAGLPERARAVFVLHDVEGHRHEDVAQMLGVTSGTTKAQLHRARRMLREALR